MILLPFVLRSSEEYGLVSLLVSIEILASNISLMGQDRAVLRFFTTDKSPRTLLRSVLTIWGTLAWLPLIAALLLYLTGRGSFFGIPLFPHLLLLSFTIAILNLNLICISISRARQSLAGFLRYRLYYVVLKFVWVLLMAWLLDNSLSYVIGVGISGFVMLIFMVPLLRDIADIRTDWAVVRRLAIFGWPLLFHVISGNILNYFSRFFLQAYGAAKDVGVFTFAFTLGSGLFVIYAALSSYFEPRIYSYSDDKPRSEQWLAYYTNMCVAVAAICGVFLLFTYTYFISYLPEDYQRSGAIIPIIMGIVLFQPLYLQGNYRLTIYQKTLHIASSTFLGSVLNVLLSILWIPSHGIWGAAMALYIANLFQGGYIFAVSMHVGDIRWRQKNILSTCAVCTIGSLSVALVDQIGFAILALLMVCLAAAGVLFRLFANRGGCSV